MTDSQAVVEEAAGGEPGRADTLVVLGMHRSGTSAVAGMFAQAGFAAGVGADVLPPAEDNPEGFFERLSVIGVNDELLGAAGGNWDAPPTRQALAEAAEAPNGPQSGIGPLLERLRHEAAGAPLLLKDPRLDLTLPAWDPFLGEDPVLVHVSRHPVEVARSLHRRGKYPLAVGLALWEAYASEALNALRGRRVLAVTYHRFMQEPEVSAVLLAAARGALRPDVAERVTTPERAQSRLDPQLWHHRASTEDAVLLTTRQLALWEWLDSRPDGRGVFDPPEELCAPAPHALAATAEYRAAVGDRYGLEVAYVEARNRAEVFEQAVRHREQQLAAQDVRLHALLGQIQQRDERIADLDGQARELRVQSEAQQHALNALRASLSWRLGNGVVRALKAPLGLLASRRH
jgi:hypothetical protein